MTRSRRAAALLNVAALLAAALLAAACGPSDSTDDRGALVIGSFGTAESEVVGEVYRLALEDAAFPVVHRAAIGDRAEVVRLLRAGDLDFVPEYLGASLTDTFGMEAPTDLASAYRALADAWFDEGFLAMLPAGAENRAGFAVRSDTAAALGLERLSDLAVVSPDLTFGGPASCREAPLCIPGLAETYGAVFGRFVATDDAVRAIADGDVDIGLVSTSDPGVDDAGLIILEDDRELVPPQSIVPILSVDASTRLGDELLAVIDSVSAALEQRALIQLNRLVASGRTPVDAAAEWLLVNGFAD